MDSFISFSREEADTIMDALIHLGTAGVKQTIECHYATKERFVEFFDKFDLIKAKLHSAISGKRYDEALKDIKKS